MTLRSVFMGTPEIAIPSLRVLAKRTDLRCVVTQPDRPAGRGNHLTAPPIKRAADELGLEVWQPETLKGQADARQLQNLDLVVVMAYGELLRRDILVLPRHGCINLHASLLPRWRGASPLQAALRAGDDHTGITVMRMVLALDAGPVYLEERMPIAPGTSLPALHDALAELAALALGRFLDGAWQHEPLPQDESQVTLCRKLITDDGHLDFNKTPAELERWVRAYTPAPGCWAVAGDQRLRILELIPGQACGLKPGEVRVSEGRLLVGCGAGSCSIVRLQVPGKRIMSAAEYLCGHRPPDYME